MSIIQTTTHQLSVKREFRALIQQQRQKTKQRQQSMLVRLSAEIER